MVAAASRPLISTHGRCKYGQNSRSTAAAVSVRTTDEDHDADTDAEEQQEQYGGATTRPAVSLFPTAGAPRV
jgi:hypothetical protein